MKDIHAIDKNKFDPQNPCDFEPFAFIENKTVIQTKRAGKIGIISFGALDYNAHYSPEFGGIALVHFDPDLIIAIKYVPWDAKERAREHQKAVKFLRDHLDIKPVDITKTFHYEFFYVLPAKKEQQRREYFRQLKEAGLGTSERTSSVPNKAAPPKLADGEELISLD